MKNGGGDPQFPLWLGQASTGALFDVIDIVDDLLALTEVERSFFGQRQLAC